MIDYTLRAIEAEECKASRFNTTAEELIRSSKTHLQTQTNLVTLGFPQDRTEASATGAFTSIVKEAPKALDINLLSQLQGYAPRVRALT